MTGPMVVGVDGTADSLAALSTAAELAVESGASLVVVHVRHESGVVAADSALAGAGPPLEDALDEIERMSRERAADVLAGRRVPWHFEVALGEDLLAGRTHGVVGGLVLGSVAQRLVRHSPVSVLVVRDGQAHRLDSPGPVSGAPANRTGESSSQ